LNPDAGDASGGLSRPQVHLVNLTSANPLPAHVKGMMVYNKTIGGELNEGVYYSNGVRWFPVISDESINAGMEPPIIFLRQPGFAWLGVEGNYEDTLAFELADVDKSGFTYQWYSRDPETLASSPVEGATSDTLFVKKGDWGIDEEGKVYQFYCVMISGSKYGISGTGHAVYGAGARIANGGWIKIANANLGADQNKPLAEQLTYQPSVASAGTGTAADKAYDPTVYGDWYQWGRKKDGHENRKTPANQTNAVYLNTVNGVGADSLDASGQIKNGLAAISGKFIQRNGGTTFDWRQYPGDGNTDVSPDNAWTWGNPVNGITSLDPCLELGVGWRVPTQAEWAQIQSNNTWVWQDGGANGTSGYLLKPGGATKPTALFLPVAGSRARYDGAQLNVGSNGYYWSSTITSTISYYSYYLSFTSGGINVASTYYRSGGYTVRCMAD
jgi:uncharacterized protein (TIGR02145 family)